MQLTEKYRPTTWTDVVGQDKAVKTLRGLVTRGLPGRAIWIAGQSGTGKTTLARIAAAEVADADFVTELDAAGLTVADLREVERGLHFRAWGKGGRAIIVNEAHGLRKDVIRLLLVMLERIPPHVLWVFTTTKEGQDSLFEDYDDAHPLLSRCLRIDLARRDLAKAFAVKAKAIAEAEGLDGQPVERYVRLAQDKRNNLRAMLQDIEAGCMVSE